MEAGRIAVVTGAGRGIGKAIAWRLAQDGYRLSLWARTSSEVDRVAREISEGGGEAMAVVTDVARWESVRQATDQTIERFGRIDILVNNAGIGGQRKPVAEADPAAWAETINVDLTGQFHCMRTILPGMIQQGNGKIVNVAGGGAGEPYPGNSAYAAAKAALVRLSETVAHEVREHHIQVNAMTPGLVVTRLTEDALHQYEANEPERAAQFRQSLETQAFDPEKGAELVAYLCSSAADGLTGRWLTVHDQWRELVNDPAKLMEEDLYVLRRYPR